MMQNISFVFDFAVFLNAGEKNLFEAKAYVSSSTLYSNYSRIK